MSWYVVKVPMRVNFRLIFACGFLNQYLLLFASFTNQDLLLKAPGREVIRLCSNVLFLAHVISSHAGHYHEVHRSHASRTYESPQRNPNCCALASLY